MDVVFLFKNVKKIWILEGEDFDDEEDVVLLKFGGIIVFRVVVFDNGDLVMVDFGGNGSGDFVVKFVKLKLKWEDSEEEIVVLI